MSNSTTSSNPVFTPAVYAEYSRRDDIPIYISLSRYCELKDKEFAFLPIVSSCFGLVQRGNQIFLGVPDMLWGRLSSLDWQHFNVKGNRLYIYYQVELFTNKWVKTSSSSKKVANQELLELCFSFVFSNMHIQGQPLRESIILHMWRMDVNREGNPKDAITLSKFGG